MKQALHFSDGHRWAAASRRSDRHLLAAALVLAWITSLTGCSSLVAIAANKIITGAGIMSLMTTGKGLADHALDMVTQQDCRILDGLLREERDVCEDRGSLRTAGDFRGILVAYRDRQDADMRQTLGLPLSLQLAYIPGESNLAEANRNTGEPFTSRVAALALDVDMNDQNAASLPSAGLASLDAVATIIQ